MPKEAGSYKDCFSSENRLRTLIALSVFFFQASSGISWVAGYMGYFLQLSGMQGMAVFDATVGISGLGAVGCVTSWYLVEKMGRRNLILSGMFLPSTHPPAPRPANVKARLNC
jgi:Sugar (and other) transporter